MSVLFIEGFETSADQTDLNKRGLLTATAGGNSGCGVVPIPSRTGVAGTGLFLRGPYGSSTALPCSVSTTSDFGMLPLNQSVYSLWQAGGFSLGINASFNSLNVFQVAPGDVQQLTYDGSVNYWAICYTGSAYVVAYSTDLKTWTTTAAQPTGISITSSILVTGTGSSATILVSNTATASTGYQTYYSTNLGGAWTAMSEVNANYGINIPTSGTAASTAPFVGMAWVNAVGYKLYYYTAVGGSQTLVNGSPVLVAASSNYIGAIGKQANGMIMLGGHKTAAGTSFPATGNVSVVATCLPTKDPTAVANWTVLAASPQQLNDVAYFNGYILGVGPNGLWYNSNTAASAWTLGGGIPSSGTFPMSAVAANSSVAVAVGSDPGSTVGVGAIWYSTNGTTWTKANRFLVNSAAGTASAIFTSVTWDGTRFIATGGLNNNIIATSTDGIAWNVIAATDYAENTGTACASFLGVFTGTQNSSTGIFTPWGTAAGNVSGVGFVAAAASSSARTVTAVSVTAGAFAATSSTLSVSAVAGVVGGAVPSTLAHYYEVVFTAVAGTTNLFNVSVYIDNTLVGNLGSYQMAATSDTTGVAQAFVNFPRTGNFTQVDDIYLTNFSGASHNARLGTQRIFSISANSDVGTDQFSNTLGGTNAATVNAALSNAEGSVYSTSTTAQDIYGTTNTVPASGMIVNAVQIEGYLSTYGGTPGAGQVGLQSNGVQKLGSIISTSVTPTRAAVIAETDPNTNAAWTISGLNAVDIVVGKTS